MSNAEVEKCRAKLDYMDHNEDASDEIYLCYEILGDLESEIDRLELVIASLQVNNINLRNSKETLDIKSFIDESGARKYPLFRPH